MTDQFYVFLVGVCCGAAGGLLYDGVGWLRALLPFRAAQIATDILFSLLFAAGYLAVNTALMLPGLRLYSFVACALGFLLYLKSLHKIVAFFGKKLYNGLKRIQRGQKACPGKEAQISRKRR